MYTGVTNDLPQRLVEHYINQGNPFTFAGRYNCYHLVFYEDFKYIEDAIAREKEIKKWSRIKKHMIIETMNPKWQTLNYNLFGQWPSKDLLHRKDV